MFSTKSDIYCINSHIWYCHRPILHVVRVFLSGRQSRKVIYRQERPAGPDARRNIAKSDLASVLAENLSDSIISHRCLFQFIE